MNLELNREYPDPDEAKLIEEMVKIAVERMKPQQGRIRRVIAADDKLGCDDAISWAGHVFFLVLIGLR